MLFSLILRLFDFHSRASFKHSKFISAFFTDSHSVFPCQFRPPPPVVRCHPRPFQQSRDAIPRFIRSGLCSIGAVLCRCKSGRSLFEPLLQLPRPLFCDTKGQCITRCGLRWCGWCRIRSGALA
jgi:hypothetical protein